ncbi:MAG: hypothetical protein E5X76_26450 [Mesorhizobium sp.]|uniref:hypothetical protein n=1 Tax=Mesorhizobium sp. TaxID=1871066 RepID=UPI00121A271E|nr:hypothetical protein [Mesorhizobium sp.]TIP04080.1 MAG: hypothetical protein E5X72_13295 [Mesorhizobium sp.]TIP37675.1 MAG: hypothetical protein E5X77_34360 [Mesorhizobium sp.]TJV69076.1 MAG: hypothetical protein E5X76_26450 [Mesorhizobium sp.]
MADLLVKLQTIATIIATGGGTYITFAGLHAWKREMKGRRDIELCQQIIAQFYEAEEKVRELRSPMSYPSVESPDRPKLDHESETEARVRDTHYVPIARWKAQKDFWNDFFSYKFRMRALFGPNASRPFEKVDEALRTFTASAFTRYESIRGDRVELGDDRAFRQEIDAAVWAFRQSRTKLDRYCTPR